MCELDNDDYDIAIELNYDMNSNELHVMDDNILVIANVEFDFEIEQLYLKNMLIRNIQKMRKLAKLKPWNIINVYYHLDNDDDSTILESCWINIVVK